MSKRVYVYRWWDGDVYRQATFDTKVEKADFMAEVRRRRRLGMPLSFEPTEPDPRLDVFIEEYWRMHAVPNLEASTRRAYLQQWERWIRPRLGALHLREITPRVVNGQLVAPMRADGAGEATILAALAVLQSVFRLAVIEDRVESNPVAKVRKPRRVVEREVPPVAPVTVELLRGRLGSQRDRTMISLLAYMGLRPEELLALDVERHVTRAGIEVRRKVVTVRDDDGHWRAEVKPYTKTRRSRFVKWTAPQVQVDVREYMLATGVRSGLLFPTRAGGAWPKHDWDNWRARVYQPAARAVGLPDPRPYDLRGSFVSLLAAEGYTMLEVARRAGHSVQTCDLHYAKIFENVDPANRVTAEEAIRAAREPRAAAETGS